MPVLVLNTCMDVKFYSYHACTSTKYLYGRKYAVNI